MPREASIQSFGALESLDIALARFSLNVQEAMGGVRPETERALDVLEERRISWQREVRHWRDVYEYADPEEDDIGYIAGRLETAEEELSKVERWQGRVEHCYESYNRQARRLDEVARNRLGEARVFLHQKIEQLRSYDAQRINRAAAASGSSILMSGARTAVTKTSSSAATKPLASTLNPSALTEFPLPKGFSWVRLDQIDPGELNELPPESDFKKVPYEEVTRGFEVLKTHVLPAIGQDRGNADQEYFRQLDRRMGLDESNGAQRVFNAFFGKTSQEFIYVDRKPGSPYFSITNGRHRIKVAMDLGWAAVPARVAEV